MSDAERAVPKSTVLSGADRRHLRSRAHGLDPVVQIGASGVTDSVVAALDHALEDHELVKLRIAGDRDERSAAIDELVRKTGSELAGTVGRTAVLYRPARDPEQRKIVLPSARRR